MATPPATGGVTLVPGDPRDASVAALLQLSEEYAYALYPPESVHMLAVEALTGPAVRFLVARSVGGQVVGCGAVVLRGATGELKRMFVDPGARRFGIGAALLAELERLARAGGVRTVLLETGVDQPEAIALYRRAGYRERGPFADYPDDPLSVFLEKHLGG